MRILKKSLAILLAFALMFGTVSVAASAADFDYANDDGNSLAITLKFFRQDAETGEWIETNRAKPGEVLRLEYYAATDYFTNTPDVGFAFDKQYFGLNAHMPGQKVDDVADYNTNYMGGVMEFTKYDATWWPETSSTLARGVRRDSLTQEEADKNYFVSGTLFNESARNQKFTDSEWLVRVNQVTVNDNAYVRTPGQEGVAYVPENFMIRAITNPAPGLYSFPKGPDEAGKDHVASDLHESGNGWTVSPTITPGVISVFSNVVLDANGGVFTGANNSTTKTISGVIGEQVTDIPAPTQNAKEFLGWSLTPDGAVLSAAEIASLLYEYEDYTLYAQWTDSDDHSYNIRYYYMNTDGTYPAEPQIVTVEGASMGSHPVSTAAAEGFVLDETQPNITTAVVAETVTVDAVLYFARKVATVYYHYTDNNGPQVDSYGDGETVIRYGAPVPPFQGGSGDPVREGYTFKGWALTEGDESTIVNVATMTMPLEDLHLYAVEEKQSFNYYFFANGGIFADGADAAADAYEYNEVPAAHEAPTREGYDFLGWDAELPAAVTEDREFNAIWSPIAYHITWKDAAGETVQEDTFYVDDEIDSTFVPDGYKEDAWINTADNTTVTFPFNMPAQDLVFQATEDAATYQAHFMVDGQEYAVTENLVNADILLPAKEPAKEGYEFLMWDPEPGIQEAEDMYFDAVFEAAECTLIYDANGGAFTADTEGFDANDDKTRITAVAEFGTELATPANPERDGYVFVGWTQTAPMNMPAGDPENHVTEIFAQWRAEQHTLTFDANGGQFIGGGNLVTVTDYTGADVSDRTPTANPVRAGYVFDGWEPQTLDGELPKTMPAEDMTFVAQWTPKQHTVTFDTNGGEPETIDPITGNTDDPMTMPDDPTKEGYTFGGWVDEDGNPVELDKIPAEDITVTADWIPNTYNAIFNANGGAFSADPADNVKVVPTEYAATIAVPADPTREGYTFEGWQPVPAEMPNHDVTFNAKWAPIPTGEADYIINVYLENPAEPGTYLDPTQVTGTVEDGTTIEITDGDSAADLKISYSGLTDSVANEPDPENENNILTITAVEDAENVLNAYFRLKTFTVNFDENGGEIEEGSNEVIGYYGEDIEKPTVSKEGYNFLGWLNDETGNIEEVPATFTKDGSYTAQWEQKSNTVTFNINGEPYETTTVNYGDPIEAPAYTVPDGYTFSGWEIPAGTTMGDDPQTYDAVLTPIDYTLTYVVNGDVPEGFVVPAAEEGKHVDETVTLAALEAPEGYTFEGWKIEGITYPPESGYTMPAKNVIAEATFTAEPVHIDFNTDFGSYIPHETHKPGDSIIADDLPVPTKPGYTFQYWETEDGNPVEDFTMPTRDVTLKAIWEQNTYTATFNLNGGNIDGNTENVVISDLKQGDPIPAPADPTKDDYNFAGWQPAVDAVMPNHDVTYVAQWTDKPVYTATFDLAGGNIGGDTTNPTQSGYAGTAITAPTDPTKEGYTFAGWQPAVDATMPEHDVTYVAQWTEIPTYTATFDLNGGNIGGDTTNPTQTGKVGDPITAPADPTKDGFNFNGWQPAVDATMPDHDVTYVAQWTELPTYTVTFDLNGGNIGGNTENPTQTGKAGDAITAPADPTREGYTFNGWDPAVDATIPEGGKTYVAQWTELPTYTATFDLAGGNIGGNTENPTQTGKAGTPITAPADPTKEGFNFAGWQPTVDATMPDHDVTYVAQWTELPTYTATFDLNGGNIDGNTENPTQTGKAGDPITAPADPTKDGFNFNGWQPTVDATMPDHDVTYVAQWTELPTYTATFDLAGGNIGGNTENPTQTGKAGTPITAPADPTKDGYTFAGWQPAVDATMPDHDVTYVAQWTEVVVPTHTVTYYLADGDDTPYQTDTYAEGDTITPAADPSVTGFTFDGWVDKDGNPLPGTMGTEDITVYAKWTPIEYKVTYINEGETYQTYDVPYGAEVPKPADPTSADSTKVFAGWEPTVPATMPAEDLTFTATYITAAPDQYTATYIVDGTTYKAYVVDEGAPIPVPADPEKFAYRFKGWNPEVPDTMPGHDVVFEAEWELDPTFITVVIGGTVIGGAAIAGIIGANTALITGASIVGGILVITLAKHTHTVKYLVDGELYRFYLVVEGTKIPVPKDPTKEGSTFQGWNPEVPEKMPATDLTFEATWDTDPAKDDTSDDVDVKIPETGSAAGIAAFTAISGAAAAAFLFMKKKRDED